MWKKIEILLAEKKMTKYELAKKAGLNQNILNYLRKNVFDLVRRSHEVEFWKNNKPTLGYRTSAEYELGDL